jgi:hypothetical protein
MNVKRMILVSAAALALAAWAGVAVAQCPAKKCAAAVTCPTLAATAKTVTVCTKCGEVAGCDACCKAGAVKCDKCALDKGSPGCCKLSAEAKKAATATVSGPCNKAKAGTCPMKAAAEAKAAEAPVAK